MRWRVVTLVAVDAALLGAAAYGMRGLFDFRMGGLGGWEIGVPKAVAVVAVWALVAGPLTVAVISAGRRRRDEPEV